VHRAVVLFALVLCGTGQGSSLFDDDTILDITLQGPLSKVIDDSVERREQAFSLSDGDVGIEVGVRMRGKSRAVHCRFPPLRLNFSAAEGSGSIFAGQDKLKLVTHCKSSAEYERNVFEEYAAYRIMNLLSDISFRARLLRIRYVDTDRPSAETFVRYGFVIEPDDAFASRHDGEVLKTPHVTRTMLDPRHSALVYVFQFLIGNTDWSLVRPLDDDYCCHNGKLFSIAERNHYLPYDFDMSGLVDARYARPQRELGISSVRTRRYRGYCTDRDAVKNALQTIVGHRDGIMRIIENFPDSFEKETKSGTRYLDGFFEQAANEDKLLRKFERRCL